MKVFLNTSPLIRPKTGIGYYVQNIYGRLIQNPQITIIPSHSSHAMQVSAFTQRLSALPRKVLGKRYPTRFAGWFYDALLSPFSRSSKGRLTGRVSIDADIYHETTHNIIPGILEAGRIKKFVADIHDLSPLVEPSWHLPESVLQFSRSLGKIKKADIIIANTHYVKNEIIERLSVPSERVRVVSIAPACSYRRVQAPRTLLHKIHKLIPSYSGKPYILYAGTVEPRKNLETLIRAFTSLNRRYDVTLIIAGGFGWKYHDFLHFCEKTSRDNIFLTGYATEEEMLALYNNATTFVFPSWYEGFGIPPLEAMACGVPVIVSNTGSLREVTGDAALSFDPASSDELKNTIEMLLDSDNLREDLIRKGYERAKKYSWDAIVSDITKIYFELCYQF